MRDVRAYDWPSPDGRESPRWVGDGFQVGGRLVRVLEFGERHDGWSDDLTALHEEAAGAEHPMDRASRTYALWQLGRHVPDERVILEVGCSSCRFLEQVRHRFPSSLVIGADAIDWLNQAAARVPGIPLLKFDLTACPLPDASVDAVVALNVLEHIADDRLAMSHLVRILRPNGIALIEVPAGPGLFDSYDEALQHFRRYSMASLLDLARDAGLEVVRASHLGAWVYPAFSLVKRIRRRRPGHTDRLMATKAAIRRTRASSGLAWCLAAELTVGRHVSYPFGIRCVVSCRKTARGTA